MPEEEHDDQLDAGCCGGLPLHVTAQRTDVGNVQTVNASTISADVRVTIELQNGETYTLYC